MIESRIQVVRGCCLTLRCQEETSTIAYGVLHVVKLSARRSYVRQRIQYMILWIGPIAVSYTYQPLMGSRLVCLGIRHYVCNLFI